MNKENSYVGQSVGRYTFNDLVGKGSVGSVYKAFDQRLLRQVAVKISSVDSHNDEMANDRILREAQIIARVEHSNIVPIYDVVDDNDLILIVMRFLTGHNLEQLKQPIGKAHDINLIVNVMRQVMLGIDYAHGKGVVHADLKPGNIFVSSSNEVFVLDFGLAAVLELETPDKRKIYGTPLYMSPEQCKSIYYDARSDIYALGLIFYTLITGQHPFAGARSMQQLLSFQKEKIPDRPESINPVVSSDLSDCVMQALEKDPTRRFNSCKDFLRGIERTIQVIDTEESSGEDMRWDPRVNMNLQARIQLQGNNESLNVEIIDLSVSGASIVCTDFLFIGSKLKIEFDILEGENAVSISSQATVLWEKKKPDSKEYEIGLSFIDLSDFDKQCLSFYIRNLLLT